MAGLTLYAPLPAGCPSRGTALYINEKPRSHVLASFVRNGSTLIKEPCEIKSDDHSIVTHRTSPPRSDYANSTSTRSMEQ